MGKCAMSESWSIHARELLASTKPHRVFSRLAIRYVGDDPQGEFEKLTDLLRENPAPGFGLPESVREDHLCSKIHQIIVPMV